MTVRAADRRPTIMKVLLLADELLLQAVRLGGNAKCVPKHHQWAFREPLRDAAFAIAFPLYRANELDVVAHAEERRRLQLEARSAIAPLTALIDTLSQLHKVPEPSLERLAGLLVDVEAAIRAWAAADERRRHGDGASN